MNVLGMDDYPNPATNMGADLTSFETLYGQFPLMLEDDGGPYRDPYYLDGDNDGVACEWNR